MSETVKKKKNEGRERSTGIINYGLNRLNDIIMRLLTVGFFANLFVGNHRLEHKSGEGFFFGASRASEAAGKEKSVRRTLLRQYRNSKIMKLLKGLVTAFRELRFNVLGLYLLIFGLGSAAIFFIEYFAGESYLRVNIFLRREFIGALFTTLLSFPFLASSQSISRLISGGVVMRGLFGDILGVPDDKFEPLNARGGWAYLVAALLGILSAGLTHFVHPFNVIAAIACIAIAVIILHFPEVGVIISIAVAPLLGVFNHPTTILLGCVLITVVSYLTKVVVGRRTLKLRFADFFVLLFGIMIAMGGIITSGGEESLKSALIYTALIAIYFLVVNLMNNEKWINKCVDFIAFSSAMVALFGVIGYSGGIMPGGWIDSGIFYDISNRATSTFSNPNILATYLIMTSPFLWMKLREEDISRSGRTFSFIGCILSFACVVLTFHHWKFFFFLKYLNWNFITSTSFVRSDAF